MPLPMNAIHPPAPKKVGFWLRQFAAPRSRYQRVFDVLFGIVAPILCAVFDPVVFLVSGPLSPGFLVYLRLFSYLVIAVEIVALGFYFLTKRASPELAGILYVGSVFSFVLGVAILPLSALGLLLLIGIFGFTPFLSALVFWRNARGCYQEGSRLAPSLKAKGLAALAAALTLAIPFGLQFGASQIANHAMHQLLAGNPAEQSASVKTLKQLSIVARTDDLVEAYRKSSSEDERQRLAYLYQQITHKSIEWRISELAD